MDTILNGLGFALALAIGCRIILSGSLHLKGRTTRALTRRGGRRENPQVWLQFLNAAIVALGLIICTVLVMMATFQRLVLVGG